MTESQLLTETARFNMIEQQIRTASVLDPVVLKLLAVVRREDFVPIAFRDLAFADMEIPLGADGQAGQTMLSPCLEARMLQELAIRNTDTVLEVGAGSGFMAARGIAMGHHSATWSPSSGLTSASATSCACSATCSSMWPAAGEGERARPA